jgi:hypothetical protein
VEKRSEGGVEVRFGVVETPEGYAATAAAEQEREKGRGRGARP